MRYARKRLTHPTIYNLDFMNTLTDAFRFRADRLRKRHLALARALTRLQLSMRYA
jgi:hypothetical protein